MCGFFPVAMFALNTIELFSNAERKNNEITQQQKENARQAEHAQLQSNDAMEKANRDIYSTRKEGNERTAKKTAQYAAGNIALDSGTTLDHLVSTKQDTEFEAQKTIADANSFARSKEYEINKLKSQNAYMDIQKKNVDRDASLSFGLSIIGDLFQTR